MNTPPVSSTANELPIASPARRIVCTAPLSGSTVPTSAFTVTNQRSPLQSGRHEMIPSVGSTTVARSYTRTSSKAGPSAVVVSVEVAAAREVAEHAAAPRRARRERKDGEQVERRRVEHREPRPLEADADGDDPAGGVEEI